jgi:hypothetical protein
VVALARRLAGMLYALWRAGRVHEDARVGQRRPRVGVAAYPQGRGLTEARRGAARWEPPGAVRAGIALVAWTAVGERAPRPDGAPAAPAVMVHR